MAAVLTDCRVLSHPKISFKTGSPDAYKSRLSENRIECSDGYFFPGTWHNDSMISLAEFFMTTFLRNFLKSLPNQNRNNMI